MARSIILILLLSVSAHADYFTWTNSAGELQHSTYRGDANGAVGAVTTSAVPPSVKVEIEPIKSAPIEMPFVVLQDVADTSKWYGVYISDGEIIGGILDHASPRYNAAIKARLQSERAQRAEMRQDARTVRMNMVSLSTAVTTAAGQQQQIEELRKAVRDLSAIIRKQLKDPTP